MFSFLTSRTTTKSATSSHPSQHRPSRSPNHSTTSRQSTSNLEGGYDDVTLEVGNSDPQSTLKSHLQQHASHSRPDFSRDLSSSGSFVGGGGGSSTNSAQYPPTQNNTRPSPTSGYPSLRSTFIRLETHLAETVPSLLDSLCPPLVPNSPALASLIDAIAPYKLPQCVIEAYNLHDGQDPFASTTVGLIWGLWWMPLDLVEIEWRFWRKFEEAGGSGGMEDAFSASTEGRSRNSRDEGGDYVVDHTRQSQEGRRDQVEEVEDGSSGGGMTMLGMSSFPKGWVRRKYSHPGWLPLLTDRAGNYVGIDLDPPPPLSPSSSSNKYDNTTSTSTSTSTVEEEGYGQPGQVIAFGREIDEKVVLFPGDSIGGWGRFLAGFTDDVIRGEFARLGEVKRGKRSAWERDNGGENGSNSKSRNTSESDEEWNDGDGIGEGSYIDGDRYGDEGEESGGSEEDIWTLRTEYRKWLSEKGEGGIVGALAERSRRKWISVGVGLPKSITNPLDQPLTPTSLAKNSPLSVVVPNLEEIEAGPESGATERPRSPNYLQRGERGPRQEIVEVRLSPPSPKRFSHQPSQHSVSSDTSNSTTQSRDYLNDGRSDRRPHSSSSKPLRRRPPPPAPMPLDLPTVFDIIESPSTSSYNPELLASDQPYTLTPTLSPTSFSREGGKPLPVIRPSTSSHSINVSKERSSTDNRHNGVQSDSTVALVSEDSGENLSLEGLGLDVGTPRGSSTSKENDLIEIVVG